RLVRMVESGDEHPRGFAVFFDLVAPGEHRQYARSPGPAEMIDQVMPQHARRIAEPIRVLARLRVEQYPRRFQGRGGDYDHLSEKFQFLARHAVDYRHASGLAGILVDADVTNDRIGPQRTMLRGYGRGQR